MAPPPTHFNTEAADNAQLPELDEAGYASLIMRSNKSMEVNPIDGLVPEPVYERIKGERASCPQEYGYFFLNLSTLACLISAHFELSYYERTPVPSRLYGSYLENIMVTLGDLRESFLPLVFRSGL